MKLSYSTILLSPLLFNVIARPTRYGHENNHLDPYSNVDSDYEFHYNRRQRMKESEGIGSYGDLHKGKHDKEKHSDSIKEKNGYGKPMDRDMGAYTKPSRGNKKYSAGKKVIEKYPGGKKAEEKYSDGTKDTEKYPDSTEVKEKYPERSKVEEKYPKDTKDKEEKYTPEPTENKKEEKDKPNDSSNSSYTNEITEMICRVNKLRRSEGKKDIALDSRLMTAAQKHSEAQLEHKQMTHEGFTPETKSFSDRFKLENFPITGGGENCAAGQKTVEQVMQSWINSPGHHANLVSDCGCFGFGRAGDYWTQAFASGDECKGYSAPDCSAY